MRAQVQVTNVSDPYGARHAILQNRQKIIDIANSRDQVLLGLGGGCRDIEVHVFPDTARGPMVIAHLIVDVRDAMGANTVNTMAEAVAGRIEDIAGGRVRLRILSNLADRSEEHTSELQSLMRISYAVFCLKKKKKNKQHHTM